MSETTIQPEQIADGVSLYRGDCLDVLKQLPDHSISAVVTDPPAGIAFMGKEWDKDKGGRVAWVAWMRDVAVECLRVLKPGGHALVWSIPRTSHWTATAWEDAGFEVRDRIAHLFGSGFPKSQNVSKAIDKAAGVEREVVGLRDSRGDYDGRERTSQALNSRWREAEGRDDIRDLSRKPITVPATEAAKQWDGWGTTLKPAMEDWWVFRKPLVGTVAENVISYGTGAINIDACRVATPEDTGRTRTTALGRMNDDSWQPRPQESESHPGGRWPAHVTHDGSDEVIEAFANFGKKTSGVKKAGHGERRNGHPDWRLAEGTTCYADTGTAARFFYTAKASKAERGDGNNHPTVKSLALMRWLVRLVCQPGGVVLDPFAGSGTTGKACQEESRPCVLIEREPAYCEIIRTRFRVEKPTVVQHTPSLFD